MERSPLGLFRSVAHQILEQDRVVFDGLLQYFLLRKGKDISTWTWARSELQDSLSMTWSKLKSRPTWIFIDALDECDESTVRNLVYFFWELGELADKNRLRLNICLSGRITRRSACLVAQRFLWRMAIPTISPAMSGPNSNSSPI